MLDNSDDRFESRSEWIEVIAAIHHQSEGSDEGRELAHEWSAQWTGYDADYTDDTWDSLGRTSGKMKTGAFILMLAKEFGWSARWPEVNPEEVFETIEDEEGNVGSADAEFENRDDEDNYLLGPPPGKKAKTGKDSDDRGPLEKMNDCHAVVRLGEKVRVLQEQPDGTQVFFNSTDFHMMFKNQRIPISLKMSQSISKAWMEWQPRRTYMGGVVFRPNSKVPSYQYNLWKGFSVEPNVEGSCKLYLDHLLHNVCKGIEDHYRYLLGWMADIIQHPERKPAVAVVMVGRKGVGKDVVAHYLGKLFDRNYVKIAEMDQLTGKFNAHFERALLIHVEEALWAGNKRAEGPLKSLISSPHVALERKGVDVIQVENFSRVMISSNEKWAVPATDDERRFFVVEVGDEHRADRTYFRAIDEQMKAGGYGALLHFLQTYDLTSFEVGNVPNTEGLSHQKVATLKGTPAFWREVLLHGELPNVSDFEREDEGETWDQTEAFCKPDDLHQSYRDWWMERRGFGHGDLLGLEEFGQQIKKMCP